MPGGSLTMKEWRGVALIPRPSGDLREVKSRLELVGPALLLPTSIEWSELVRLMVLWF